MGLPLIRRRVAEISQTVIVRAHDVAGKLNGPGADSVALSQLAAMAAERAGRCAVTVLRLRIPTIAAIDSD